MEGTESNWEVYIQSVPFDRGLCTSERGYWTFWTSEGAFWSFATQLARKSNREQSFTVYTVCWSIALFVDHWFIVYLYLWVGLGPIVEQGLKIAKVIHNPTSAALSI